MFYCSGSFCVVLCRPVSYCVVLCRTVSNCVELCRTVSNCVVLCCTACSVVSVHCDFTLGAPPTLCSTHLKSQLPIRVRVRVTSRASCQLGLGLGSPQVPAANSATAWCAWLWPFPCKPSGLNQAIGSMTHTHNYSHTTIHTQLFTHTHNS